MAIEGRPNVILYLPPGPLYPPRELGDTDLNGSAQDGNIDVGKLSNTGPENHPAHVLATASSSTVVTVNYRLGTGDPADESELELYSEQNGYQGEEQEVAAKGGSPPFYKYPTPIHDTLAGFDWILQNLQPAQLSVLGMHIGGSLALMLALTESKSLHAVAALEPVCDWVELDEYCTIPPEIGDEIDQSLSARKGKGRRSIAPPDLVLLLQARKSFFTSPERYFDSFASPILFLRSSGSYVPRRFPEYLTGPKYPIPVLKEPPKVEKDKDDYWDTYSQLLYSEDGSPRNPSDWESDSDYLTDPADIHKGIRRRKSLSRWPPFGLDYGLDDVTPRKEIGRLEMVLPWVRVFAREQADELPVIPYNRPRYARRSAPRRILEWQAGEMVSVMRKACFWGRESGFAEERVTLATTGDEKWIRDAAEWLEDRVESPSDR